MMIFLTQAHAWCRTSEPGGAQGLLYQRQREDFLAIRFFIVRLLEPLGLFLKMKNGNSMETTIHAQWDGSFIDGVVLK